MKHGRIVLDNAVDQFTLLAYAADPDAVLDVTGLDLARLPFDVKASLYSAAAVFHAPHLRVSLDIEANRATSFLAPELRTAGSISATDADRFEVPQLQAAGSTFATSAGEFVARDLVTAGDVDAFVATNFETQSLRTAGYINAYFTKCFRALQLCECRMLRVPGVKPSNGDLALKIPPTALCRSAARPRRTANATPSVQPRTPPAQSEGNPTAKHRRHGPFSGLTGIATLLVCTLANLKDCTCARLR
jgi:hypothetical protein